LCKHRAWIEQVVAAELTQQANNLQQLGPMLDATAATLAAAGVQDRPGTVLADSGYWTIANFTQLPRRTGAADPAGPARPPGQAPQGRQAVGVQM
jgi:hypothetical protein